MQKFYKVFLILFVVIIGINLYAIDWHSNDFLSEDNQKFIFSAAAGIIGVILLLVLNTWSKIGVKK